MKTVFDAILSGELPSACIYQDARAYAFMDAFPQSTGHCLIIPKAPARDIFAINPEDLAHIAGLSQKIAFALQKALCPDGIRIAQFNGEAAGQTVFYYHLHLIPIWHGKKEHTHGSEMVPLEILEKQAQKIRQALI